MKWSVLHLSWHGIKQGWHISVFVWHTHTQTRRAPGHRCGYRCGDRILTHSRASRVSVSPRLSPGIPPRSPPDKSEHTQRAKTITCSTFNARFPSLNKYADVLFYTLFGAFGNLLLTEHTQTDRQYPALHLAGLKSHYLKSPYLFTHLHSLDVRSLGIKLQTKGCK